MALWSWRTLPDQSVEVDKGRGPEIPKTLSNPYYLKAQVKTASWLPLAIEVGKKYNVPPSWILGVIFAESGGNPAAENYCCVGLMAISYQLHKQTRADMLDPEKNMDYGTSLLAKSRGAGYDLPSAASLHVAGGGVEFKPHSGTCCSAKCNPNCKRDKNGNLMCVTHPEFPGGSPWGMCEHMFPKTAGDGAVGYIDRVVRANNSFVELVNHGTITPPGPGPGPTPGPGPEPIPGPSGGSPPPPMSAGFLGTLAPFVIGGVVGFFAFDKLFDSPGI